MVIGVIIPSHGLVDKLERCLKALLASVTRHDLIPVVIDNGTSDWSVQDLVRELFAPSEAMYIKLPWNASFARASNTGMLVCGQADAYLFLNNDCYLDPQCLEVMADALMNGKGDVIGARLRYSDGTIQHAGGGIIGDWEAVTHIYRGLSNDAPEVTISREVSWVTAACMLVPAVLFISSGCFLEIYENGYEDVDFCLRIKENGKRIFYCAEATAIHEEAQTPGRKDNEVRNNGIFFNRWRHKDVVKFQVNS